MVVVDLANGLNTAQEGRADSTEKGAVSGAREFQGFDGKRAAMVFMGRKRRLRRLGRE